MIAVGIAAGMARDPEEEFGPSQQVIQERDPSGWVDSITGTVASVRQNASGRYLVELENGQVWMQTETNSYPVAMPGDMVKIKRAAGTLKVRPHPRSPVADA